MTNTNIRNAYLRKLAAREINGWHEVWRRSRHYRRNKMRRDELISCVHAIVGAYARMDLHLRRHGAELVAGDVTPLAAYPGAFAGHE